MSWLDRAQSQLASSASAIKAIALLRQIVKHALAHKKDAVMVLRVADRMFDTIVDGFTGKITAAEVDAHADEMFKRLVDVDAAADSALDDKFGKGTP
jgi:rhamnogalacturonyl hydrolase YesR